MLHRTSHAESAHGARGCMGGDPGHWGRLVPVRTPAGRCGVDTSRNARCRAELRATSHLSTKLLWAFLPPSYAPTRVQTPPSAVGTAAGPESPHFAHSRPRISTSTLMAGTPEAHIGPQGCPATGQAFRAHVLAGRRDTRAVFFHKNLFVGLLFDFAGVVLDQFPLV